MGSLEKLLSFKFKVGRVWRIDVYIHWTLLGLAAWQLYQFRAKPKLGLLVMLGIWASIFLHEMGHCWGARRVGGDAREILLWPLGGLAMLHTPLRPWPVFFSTLTGPLVNVILGLIALPIYLSLGGDMASLWPANPITFTPNLGLWALYYFVFINLILMFFNIIPAFPLDGGRMMQAALWPRLGFHKATTIAIWAAFFCAGLIIIAAIFWAKELILGLIGVYIIHGSLQERARLRYGVYEEQLAVEPWKQGFSGHDEKPQKRPGPIARWLARRKKRREDAEAKRMHDMRERLDQVLAKVSAEGLDQLTREEKQFLDRASRELRRESDSN